MSNEALPGDTPLPDIDLRDDKPEERLPDKPPAIEGILLGFNEVRRVHCGLSWDPESSSAIPSDLDLVYALYDQFGRFLGATSGKDNITTDSTGNIYHSGDDADGAETGDDERVTIDLFSMPSNIHYIFLLCEISSHHFFGNVVNPLMHMMKAPQNEEIIKMRIATLDGNKSKAFIFTRLDRVNGGWSLNKVAKFTEGEDLPDWENVLLDYLPAVVDEARTQANLPDIPKKGEMVKLAYSLEGRQRVICGASWDVRPGGYDEQIDVDLTCIMFDSNGDYVADVSSDPSRAVDTTGSVYHSGDEITGAGGGDDETISVELAFLPETVVDIVFLIDMKTDHRLSDILNPTLRIADAKTDVNQIHARADQSDKQANAYIFARLAFMDEGWVLHYISKPLDTATITDWTQAIRPYLTGEIY